MKAEDIIAHAIEKPRTYTQRGKSESFPRWQARSVLVAISQKMGIEVEYIHDGS